MTILVTGASGFIGSHAVRHLLQRGHAVRGLVRATSNRERLASLNVQVIEGNVEDIETLRRAAQGVEVVVHTVGIIAETSGKTFAQTVLAGTRNLVVVAKDMGVRRFIFLSAMGVEHRSTAYWDTKFQGEQIVKESGMEYTNLRPSLVLGAGSKFLRSVVEMVKKPVPSGVGAARLQPIDVGDVCQCIAQGMETDKAVNGTFELGGRDVVTFEEMARTVAEFMGRKLVMFPMPLSLLRVLVGVGSALRLPLPITADQLKMLSYDNVASRDDLRQVFGVEPKPFRESVKEFFQRSDGVIE
jgi:NADH dehydrogenase